MKFTLKTKLASALVLLIACGGSVRGDELAEKGRAIFQKHQQAVVTVQIVLKSKITSPGAGGRSSESRQSASGTVVDPAGLAVLSLAATDPSQMVQNMMAGEDSRIQIETEVSDIKMVLEDGTELAAEVVLRDNDLDLAFIRPKAKPATPLKAIDLNDAGTAGILDQVIALNRLGNAAGRAYSASAERISAIVQRPRLFYVPDSNMTTSTLGSPAFTLDGKFLGLFVMRSVKGRGNSGGMFSTQSDTITGIILPAQEIAKAAKQVPAATEAKEQK